MFQFRGSIFAATALAVVVATVQCHPQSVSERGKVVPSLVNFSGVLTDGDGNPVGHATYVIFAIYADENGQSPLWSETQSVQPDAEGRYSVLLGAMSEEGLPGDIFASGEARWLGVQPQGEAEQPRIRLLSVPYAIKAGDAETLGGLPASAFLQSSAKSVNRPAKKDAVPLTAPAVTGSGTAGYLPLWDSASDITSSGVVQAGTGPNAAIGINTTAPTAALDVGSGHVNIENGNLILSQATGTSSGVIAIGETPFISACCAANTFNTFVGLGAGNYGNPSTDNTAVGFQALTSTNTLSATENTAVGATSLTSNLAGSSNTALGVSSLFADKYGSSNTAVGTSALQNVEGLYNTAVGQGAGSAITSGSSNTFIGQGANAGTNISSLTNATAIGANAVVSQNNSLVLGASGVNVGINTSTPAYTLDVNGTANFSGLVTFAPNQTFPGGSGSGTITGVTAGAGLTGGGTSGNVTLSLTNTCAKGQMLQWSGSTWACTTPAGSTLTGVAAGTGLLSSASGGVVTLSINPTAIPQLTNANTFTGTQTVSGNLALTGSGNGVMFPDGSLQTTAASAGGGGIPSGFMILGTNPTAPPGYTLSGAVVSGNIVMPMPGIPARSHVCAAAVNGKIYAIGGYALDTKTKVIAPSGIVEVFDPATDAWTTLTPAPNTFAQTGGCVALNSEIQVLQPPMRFNPSSGKEGAWAQVGYAPAAVSGMATVPTAFGPITVGGYGSKNTALGSMEVFSGTEWTGLKPMPTARGDLAAAYDPVGENLYAIGGIVGGSTEAQVSNKVEVYSFKTKEWSEAAPLPTARAGLAAFCVNGAIVAIGGFNYGINAQGARIEVVLNTIEVYNIASGEWTGVASPLSANEFFGSTTSNYRAYILGGTSGGSTLFNTAEQYAPPATQYTFTKN